MAPRTSALTTPSTWVFKSKDEKVISKEEILLLCKSGFKTGVTDLSFYKEKYVKLELEYSATEERIKNRFGSAPVACMRLRNNETIEETEQVKSLAEKFNIKPPTVVEYKNGKPLHKKRKHQERPSKKNKRSKIQMEVDQGSDSINESDSDENYFTN